MKRKIFCHHEIFYSSSCDILNNNYLYGAHVIMIIEFEVKHTIVRQDR